MTDEFHIAFDPISREHGPEIERATLASVTVWVQGYAVTRVEDTLARTVRDSARVSVLRLATWFIENWWRLRWEPESARAFPSWRMSHNMAAAGGGYLWPRVTFSSEGNYMRVRALPTPGRSTEHIRYLADFDVEIPMMAFEQAIDDFVEGVLARIVSLELDARELQNAWAIIRSERADPTEADLRKLEALLGCDPEEAPQELLASLRRSETEFGAEAIGEVAAASDQDHVSGVIEAFRSHMAHPDDLVSIPELSILRNHLQQLPPTDVPWWRAEYLAAFARETWSVGHGPIRNDTFFQLLGSHRVLDEKSVPFAAGFRAPDTPDRFAVSCRARYAIGRRFELVRLIADQIAAAPRDRLLPASSTKTGRQKFQRAFASEFLCPYKEIKAALGHGFPSDDDIECLAEEYDVSSLLVRTSLINKGDLPRDALIA